MKSATASAGKTESKKGKPQFEVDDAGPLGCGGAVIAAVTAEGR